MAKQLGFLIDLEKCIGCKACEMACKNERKIDEVPRWRRVVRLGHDPRMVSSEQVISLACNHCENPECFRVCPQRAYHKRRDGIVIHNPLRCNGCKQCIGACPFRTPQYNPLTKKVEKCDLCADRIDAGGTPACVEACLLGALQVIDIRKGLPEGALERVSGFVNIKVTKPSVRFMPAKPVSAHLRKAGEKI